MTHPTITVAICTYNRAELLRETLATWTTQTVDAAHFTVLIVDNNSTDHTQEVSEWYTARHSNFKYVLETKQGVSNASNTAIAACQTEWLAYVDDDAKAHSDYIEVALEIIANYKFDAFGGLYLGWYKYGKPFWFPDELSHNRNGKPTTIMVLEDGYLSGSNMIFKKDLLVRIGGFDPTVGMIGTRIVYGKETYLQNKFREAGGVIGFVPHLVVDHVVNKHKLRPSWILDMEFAQGRDYWAYNDLKPSLARYIRIAGKRYLRLITDKQKLYARFVGVFRASWFAFGLMRTLLKS